MAGDTREASVITDHAFTPRTREVVFLPQTAQGWVRHGNVRLRPTPYLCQHCRMAEAAHRETTIKREHIPSMVTLCKGEHPWTQQRP